MTRTDLFVADQHIESAIYDWIRAREQCLRARDEQSENTWADADGRLFAFFVEGFTGNQCLLHDAFTEFKETIVGLSASPDQTMVTSN